MKTVVTKLKTVVTKLKTVVTNQKIYIFCMLFFKKIRISEKIYIFFQNPFLFWIFISKNIYLLFYKHEPHRWENWEWQTKWKNKTWISPIRKQKKSTLSEKKYIFFWKPFYFDFFRQKWYIFFFINMNSPDKIWKR